MIFPESTFPDISFPRCARFPGAAGRFTVVCNSFAGVSGVFASACGSVASACGSVANACECVALENSIGVDLVLSDSEGVRSC